MMDYKPCQICGVASLIGMDNECESCWEIKTRIHNISMPLLVKLIREVWTPEMIKEFGSLLNEKKI